MLRTAMLALAVSLSALAAALAQSELVLQKEGTRLYHRAGCPVVRDGVGVLALSRAQAESRGLKAHEDCDPEKAPATTGASAPQPAAPVFVWLDESKYYHREQCRKLEGERRKVRLEEAAKGRWPCPTCKPPRRGKPAPAVPRR